MFELRYRIPDSCLFNSPFSACTMDELAIQASGYHCIPCVCNDLTVYMGGLIRIIHVILNIRMGCFPNEPDLRLGCDPQKPSRSELNALFSPGMKELRSKTQNNYFTFDETLVSNQ